MAAVHLSRLLGYTGTMNARILKDCLLGGTPFRGLIVQNEFALCAYLGVPRDHWLADMESLEFDCHWGVTFRGEGGDGIRPENWFWYGWDYAHAGDYIGLPPEIEEYVEKSMPNRKKGKRWRLAEVEHDLIDAALNLKASIDAAVMMSGRWTKTSQHSTD